MKTTLYPGSYTSMLIPEPYRNIDNRKTASDEPRSPFHISLCVCVCVRCHSLATAARDCTTTVLEYTNICIYYATNTPMVSLVCLLLLLDDVGQKFNEIQFIASRVIIAYHFTFGRVERNHQLVDRWRHSTPFANEANQKPLVDLCVLKETQTHIVFCERLYIVFWRTQQRFISTDTPQKRHQNAKCVVRNSCWPSQVVIFFDDMRDSGAYALWMLIGIDARWR